MTAAQAQTDDARSDCGDAAPQQPTFNPWTREQASERARKLLKQIKRAKEAGENTRASKLSRRYLRSAPARVHAAYKVLEKNSSREPTSPDDAAALAARVNAWQSQGQIVAIPIPKANGGLRTICVLPEAAQAAQYIIKDLFELETGEGGAFNFGPHNYSQKGRGGKDGAVAAVKSALRAGNVYCAVGDIQSCFDSVNTSRLYDILDLPRTVIERNIDTRTARFHFPRSLWAEQQETELPEEGEPELRSEDRAETGAVSSGHARGDASNNGQNGCDGSSLYRHRQMSRAGPAGLMQGAPTSNLILGRLLHDMPSAMPSDYL